MQRISKPASSLEERDFFDVVVVGSGYGGAIAASRLSRASRRDNGPLRVCVLERGSERLPGEYPETPLEMLEATQLHTRRGHSIELEPGGKRSRMGLYDIHLNDDLNVLIGCGLGGTSLINANVALPADKRVFADPIWPQQLRSDLGRLEQGSVRAQEMLRPERYPLAYPALHKLEALEESARALGPEARIERTPINVTFHDGPNHVGVEQRRCVLCGNCVSGCNHFAKNTLLMNYLPDARKHGAEIFSGAAVKSIERGDTNWIVRYQALDTGMEPLDSDTRTVEAGTVILAAGALGSTEILLRSKCKGLALSKQVGARFSGNGDVVAFGYNSEREINGIGVRGVPKAGKGVGPCITGVIDLRDVNRLDDGMVIEDASVPYGIGAFVELMLMAAAPLEGIKAAPGTRSRLRTAWRQLVTAIRGPHHGAMRNTQTFLAMSHDGAEGRLNLENNRLRVDWPGVGSEPIFRAVDDQLKTASGAIGATHVRDPLWTELLGHQLITVHPLGGCPMADDAASGVVDHKGRVFAGRVGNETHDGLYVIDGSIVPRSLGVNPLLTISALAERCCALMADDRDWTIAY